MSTLEWNEHVKQVRKAYAEAGISISHNQAMFLARESYKEVKAGNPNPEITIDENQIPAHKAGRIPDSKKEVKEIKYVEPKRVPLKKKQLYEEEPVPKRRVVAPQRVTYEDEYEEDYVPKRRVAPRPRGYDEYEYEEDEYYRAPPPRRGRGGGVPRGRYDY